MPNDTYQSTTITVSYDVDSALMERIILDVLARYGIRMFNNHGVLIENLYVGEVHQRVYPELRTPYREPFGITD